MDATQDIKLRLSIEQLVGEYCQIHKKGRQLKCLCPFHNDKHPSMLISPDKGIAYCFACNSGGDIFSFYQKIEGVDFVQALKDLADKAGVELPKESAHTPIVSKDEKTRLRECIFTAMQFYEQEFTKSTLAKDYVHNRGVDTTVITEFHLGYAPDSYTATYDYLLKQGFSKTEIIKAGISAERDLDGKVYDRFRNRLMIPIFDSQGRAIAFGGRTLGNDDAKYINSPEGVLYNKSVELYGYAKAKETIRSKKSVVIVEGYFDVIACHRAGVTNAIAVSGTALTEQQVQLLKRTVDQVVLCLDQDTAGKTAAERSFALCAEQNLEVRLASITGKDPDEALVANKDQFIKDLTKNHKPYIEALIQEHSAEEASTLDGKKRITAHILPLLQHVTSTVEKEYYIDQLAQLLQTSPTNIRDDLSQIARNTPVPIVRKDPANKTTALYDRVDLALGTFLHFPQYHTLIQQLIEPTGEFQKALYTAIKQMTTDHWSIADLELTPEQKEQAAILHVYCDNLDWNTWSDMIVMVNIKKQCQFANQAILQTKAKQTIAELKEAQTIGNVAKAEQLTTTINQELKLRHQSE